MRNLLLIGILACALQTGAQTGSSESTPEYAGRVLPIGWSSFAEISTGYTGDNNAIPVEGVPSSIKILGSYYTLSQRGVYDLGLGAHSQTFIDNTARDSTINTAVMEAAARYQFESRWQLGVVYNQFFDRGRNYFSNQGDSGFGGIQLLKELTVGDKTDMRIGLRAMTDLNTDGQDINMAQVDLAFGWNSAKY